MPNLPLLNKLGLNGGYELITKRAEQLQRSAESWHHYTDGEWKKIDIELKSIDLPHPQPCNLQVCPPSIQQNAIHSTSILHYRV